MKVLINYANEAYRPQQKYNTATGYKKGGFDKVIEYSPEDIDENFKKKYKDILSFKRGNGLWLWKPYIIKKTLEELNDDDYLFYCDSGAFFIKPIDILINKMEQEKVDVMPFSMPLTDLQFSSKQCIDSITGFDLELLLTPQRQSGFILLKKSAHSIRIINQFMEFCQRDSLLEGGESGPYCLAHRVDQSIWSLLTKKEGIKSFRDPTQYSVFYKEYINWCTSHGDKAIVSIDQEMNKIYPTVLILYRKDALYSFWPRIKYLVKLKIKSLFL